MAFMFLFQILTDYVLTNILLWVNGRPVEFMMFAERTLSRARANQEGGIRQIYGLF